MSTLKILVKDFDLEYTLSSGQCFNFKREREYKYIGVLEKHFIQIEQRNNLLIIESTPKIDEEKIIHFFNLNIDYENIISILLKNKEIEPVVEKYKGLRIVNQEPYECFFSYIISSFNSIKKVQLSRDILSQKLGEKITDDFYTFPTKEKLKDADNQILKDAKLGYRSEYIKKSAQKLISDNLDLYQLKAKEYTDAKNTLLSFPGIGDKVSDCILLYSLGFHDAFPEDVWIKRYLKKRVKRKEEKIQIKKNFENFSGWAQLFIFKSIRDGYYL